MPLCPQHERLRNTDHIPTHVAVTCNVKLCVKGSLDTIEHIPDHAQIHDDLGSCQSTLAYEAKSDPLYPLMLAVRRTH